MEKQLFNNTLSIITKEETVKTLSHHIISNTGVLEAVNPFPGYYSSNFITSESKPETLFILLSEKVTLEFFYRRLYNIEKKAKFEFSAALAELEFNNKVYKAIRIFNLETYDSIIKLEEFLIEEGFKLRKSLNIDSEALIHIKKFCNLELVDGVYYSSDNSHFIYFNVENSISWKEFEVVAQKIRHNYLGNNFDAGLGVIFHHNKVEDVVRIYSKDLTKEDLNKLKDMFQNEIS